MLDLKYIKNNKELVKEKLKTRSFDVSLIDEIFKITKNYYEINLKIQELNSKRNSISKEISILKSKNENYENALKEVSSIKTKIEPLSEKLEELKNILNNKITYIPNLPNQKTPIGNSEKDNIVIREHANLGRGKIVNVIPHYEIGIKKNIIDFEDTVKISGSRFWSYKGQGAKLIRSLENWLLDKHSKNGYEELRTPVLVKSNTLQGTGQLPKFKEDLFKIEEKDLWLIPTAEVTLTNFYGNRILNLEKSIKLTGFTSCFRAEAGSGGKDMKGLIRSHQFNKVELVKITNKENYDKEYLDMLKDVRKILIELKIPFQELQLCTGDLGFSAEETVDFEIWIPSEKRYRETSSVSKFSDFQCRRGKTRYKDINSNSYAYSINGSGLALDRVIAAIIENYQNEDGTISIPEPLIPYMGVEKI